jgi:HlyD family secretion protein
MNGPRVRLAARQHAGVAVAALCLACHDHDQPDAFGNFETNEVVVSAQTSGQLLFFQPEEGQRVTGGALVAVVDTAQLALEQAQIAAQRSAARSRAAEVGQQLDALRVQYDIARRNYERTRRLFADQAATAQQLDQAEREYKVLGEQIQATEAQQRTVASDIASADARVAQIRERIDKSRITNPVTGTVLATYAKKGEFVQAAQPLYKIANLDSMVLRAYVTEPQLARVKLGSPAQVSLDAGGKRRETLSGTVSWISSEAEFTPTPIQTRDERRDLVYAVKIRVPNLRGVAKIVMPADVRFVAAMSATP